MKIEKKNEIRKIPLLNVPYFMENSEGSSAVYVYNEELVALEFDNENGGLYPLRLVPIEIDAFSILIVRRGQCCIHIDYIPHHLKENTFIVLRKKLIISSLTFSDDFVGCQLIVKPDFLRMAMGNNVLPVREIMERNMPLLSVVEVDPADFDRLSGFIQQLIQGISLDSHLFQRSIIQNSLGNVLMELWNVIAALSPEEMQQRRVPTMKEKMAFRFIQMLHVHCKEKHDVSYYAAELNVSTAHLTRILKEVTGKTGSEWISEILVNEAKLLLHYPGNSVQSIAMELNFSDQASLSKFFRKNTKMSPLEYRNKLRVR